jgi:hypothetical protein
MKQPPDKRRFPVIDASGRREAKKICVQRLAQDLAGISVRPVLRRGDH